MSKELYAIILAGNSDEKLWPLEGKLHPANTYSNNDEYTIFQQTFINLTDCVDDKNIICATTTQNKKFVEKQLKELQEKFCRTTRYKIIEEPESRGTAPAIALSVKYISERIEKEDATIVVIPSDLLIRGNFKFDYFLEKGKQLAQAGYIVCMGTKPGKPNPNIGYIITRNDKKTAQVSKRAFKAASFIEKPNLSEAKKLVKDKKVYANCGIYVFNASTFFSQLKSSSPQMYKDIESTELRQNMPVVELKQYEKFEKASIETQLIEKTKKLSMISMNIDFTDCGYWQNIEEIMPKDKSGNTLIGNTVDISSKNTFVFSSSRLVTTSGLKDVYVIDTPETLLVCNKDDITKIKDIRKSAKKNKIPVPNTTVAKPWGYYTVLNSAEGYLTKLIYVNPHARLSLQMHNHRTEHWVVLSGSAKVIKGESEIVLNTSEGIDIGIKEPHSLQNPYDEPLQVLEIQTGELLSEDDIIRLEDIYGRV